MKSIRNGIFDDMADKRPRGTHNPSQRSTQRWENEGGATKDARAGRASVRRQSKNADTADMAAPVIDRLADRSATFEQQEGRKRRLLEGPKEFRDMRRDHRK